jgi:hypothetical protein
VSLSTTRHVVKRSGGGEKGTGGGRLGQVIGQRSEVQAASCGQQPGHGRAAVPAWDRQPMMARRVGMGSPASLSGGGADRAEARRTGQRRAAAPHPHRWGR